ncbi:MAG: VanZ family protein [Mariniphaga sp.]
MILILFAISQRLRIILSLIYLGCIAILSLLPSADIPQVPMFPGADKIVHLCMYLGLSAISCWSMHAEINTKWYYLVILFAVSWGITMEIFQKIMNLGRSFELLDILSNSIGAIIGVALFMLLVRLKNYIELRKADNLRHSRLF